MGMQKYQSGFTIIEVMLFLAVSAALAVAVLGTALVGISNQRYIDAVNSFKALVQEEFTNTTHVINSRQGSTSCLLDPLNVKPVGATDCVVMGRMLTVDNHGNFGRANIVGKAPAIEADVADIDAIKAYTPDIDTAGKLTGTMNWGTHLKNNEKVSIAIFRSPVSGNILSFVHRGSLITSKNQLHAFMISPEFENRTPKVLCIDPSGWTVAESQSVIITPYAAGPAGVEQKTGEPVCA